MPSWEEALAAVQGLKRLIRFDAGFAAWFDRSAAGALRSFGLMLPMLPCFLILRFVNVELVEDVSTFRLAGATAANFALSWVMYPLFLIVIGRALERENQAIGTITFYNWFNFFLVLVATALHLLEYSGMLGAVPRALLVFLVFASLILEGFAFRILLGVGYGGAVLLVFLDYVLTQSLYILLMSPLFQPQVT
ncbi:MAG: hypothetical protein JNL25_14415 [Rhodospirillaceae bacterium]|nr:hypothetical protein [Rhodospirillaceae bacterium]